MPAGLSSVAGSSRYKKPARLDDDGAGLESLTNQPTSVAATTMPLFRCRASDMAGPFEQDQRINPSTRVRTLPSGGGSLQEGHVVGFDFPEHHRSVTASSATAFQSPSSPDRAATPGVTVSRPLAGRCGRAFW
jgi:hypothetical protein